MQILVVGKGLPTFLRAHVGKIGAPAPVKAVAIKTSPLLPLKPEPPILNVKLGLQHGLKESKKTFLKVISRNIGVSTKISPGYLCFAGTICSQPLGI